MFEEDVLRPKLVPLSFCLQVLPSVPPSPLFVRICVLGPFLDGHLHVSEIPVLPQHVPQPGPLARKVWVDEFMQVHCQRCNAYCLAS